MDDFHFIQYPFPCLIVHSLYKSYISKLKQYLFSAHFPFGQISSCSAILHDVDCAAAPVEDVVACYWLRQCCLLSLAGHTNSVKYHDSILFLHCRKTQNT